MWRGACGLARKLNEERGILTRAQWMIETRWLMSRAL